MNRENYYYVSEVDISERGDVWRRNLKEKQERMKKELEIKNNEECTFAPKIKKKNKSALQKNKFEKTSAFMKDGLSGYFDRINRAKNLNKNKREKTPPPPLYIQQKKYESKVKPSQMLMQKTEENFYDPSLESNQPIIKPNKYESKQVYINNQILHDLSRNPSFPSGSPNLSMVSKRNQEPSAFDVTKNDIMQGLFSSNETGSLQVFNTSHEKRRHIKDKHSPSQSLLRHQEEIYEEGGAHNFKKETLSNMINNLKNINKYL